MISIHKKENVKTNIIVIITEKNIKNHLNRSKKRKKGLQCHCHTFGISKTEVTIEQIVKKSVFGQTLTTFALNSNKTTTKNQLRRLSVC